MDAATLLNHRDAWVEEEKPHPADGFASLTATEQQLYQSIKTGGFTHNTLINNIRLEQERIPWDIAWAALQACLG